jgi:hypothetical protein
MEGNRIRLTKQERLSILQRDDFHSQLRNYSEEKGFHTNENCPYDNRPCPHLEVHHVLPVGAGGKNEPENLITLFSCQHVGRCPSNRIRN